MADRAASEPAELQVYQALRVGHGDLVTLHGFKCAHRDLLVSVLSTPTRTMRVRCTLSTAMPRPRSVTPERIARAALAVIDRDGLEGLSMRAVGQELGMGTMSLYRYVPDRGAL